MIKTIRNHNPNWPAIIQAQDAKIITYGELLASIDRVTDLLLKIRQGPSLVFLYSTNSVDSIVIYLSCLSLHFPICLLEPSLVNLPKMIDCYQPGLLLLPPDIQIPDGYIHGCELSGNSYRVCWPVNPLESNLLFHPDLQLLLPTSGSTGNPKFVRLTHGNILSNAQSIATYLELSPRERPIQGLPMYYSYGLSIINSHFVAGGATVLTSHSFMRPEFWSDFDTHSCTSFAGVPYMYETLHRLKFDSSSHPTLRTMTQAGGGLRPDLIQSFYEKSSNAGVRFFVMYGQTEATARISYVPPDRLEKKIGSIGISIPGGQLELAGFEGMSGMQELIYHGPNVMMGYAESLKSLALGDELHGVLHTGDLARKDDDGFFYLVGRLKRFAKLYGQRINLADVESHIEAAFPVYAVAVDAGDSHLHVYIEMHDDADPKMVQLFISKYLKTTPKAIIIKTVDKILFTTSGKKDYKALEE